MKTKLSLLFPKEELERLIEAIKAGKGQELIIDGTVYKLKKFKKMLAS